MVGNTLGMTLRVVVRKGQDVGPGGQVGGRNGDVRARVIDNAGSAHGVSIDIDSEGFCILGAIVRGNVKGGPRDHVAGGDGEGLRIKEETRVGRGSPAIGG